jgi:Cdc6-like AAA superfamily ATPase
MSTESPQAKKFLHTLENSLSPFEKFVAKYDIEETLPLVQSRQKDFFARLRHALRDFPSRIIPIAGETGTGKTYILWQMRRALEIRSPTVFLDVPANASKFYYEIYTKIFEELGTTVLRDITTQLADRWGASERKYGLFRLMNTEKILESALKSPDYERSVHKKEFEQCLKVIIAHAMDSERLTVAERWLLGDNLDADDLFFLGVENDLSHPHIAEELFHIIVDYIPEGILLIFDDIDKNWQRYNIYSENGDEEDWTECSDPNCDSNSPVSDSQSQSTFFDRIVEIIESIRNIKVILTMHGDNVQAILSKFPPKSRSSIRAPLYLPEFTFEDAKDYYLDALGQYQKKHHLEPVANDPYFPLTEQLIHAVYDHSKGNPRQLIRNFQKVFDSLIFDELSIAEIEQKLSSILR